MKMERNNRLWPPDIDASEGERYLKAIADWLGEDWLQDKNGRHPLQQLWRDLTPQSSVELFNIGHAIDQQRSLVGNDWFSQERSETRSFPQGIGPLYEVLTASFFHDPEKRQISRLCEAGREGYDVHIDIEKRRGIRISCKALGLYTKARTFRTACDFIVEQLVEAVESSDLESIQMLFQMRTGKEVTPKTAESFRTTLSHSYPSSTVSPGRDAGNALLMASRF